jgi:integrase
MANTPTGIRVRHSRSCPANGVGACTQGRKGGCVPSYEAFVYSKRDGRKIRKAFPTLAAAKSWRADASSALRRGTLRAPTSTTLRDAAEALLAGMRDGSIRNRSGDAYKPSAIRGYEQALRDRVVPELGSAKLCDIRRADLQDLADRLLAGGADPSTIRNTLMPVRVIYRRATGRGDIAVNPTTGLELPAVRGKRDRIASPREAAELLDALPEQDRTVWATAMYAGLRRGELLALRWDDVDLAAGVIRVERSWDPKAGVIVEPKTRAGLRVVPIATVLRSHLLEHRLRSGRSEGLVFGRTVETPANDSTLIDRAAAAWRRASRERATLQLEGDLKRPPTAEELEELLASAALEPISLHECRHTFASLMIAAGVNAKALSTYMGHASITITLDRYGHLFPGNEDEAAQLLDAYLARAETNVAAQADR